MDQLIVKCLLGLFSIPFLVNIANGYEVPEPRFTAFPTIYRFYDPISDLMDINEYYETPEPQSKLFYFIGFEVSIPDEGLSSVTIHFKVNEKFEGLDGSGLSGKFNKPNLRREWTYRNNLLLNGGDKIYYWIFVVKDGLEYIRESGEMPWTLIEIKDDRWFLVSEDIMLNRYIVPTAAENNTEDSNIVANPNLPK